MATTKPFVPRRPIWRAGCAILGVIAAIAPVRAAAQTAGTLYERAQSQERDALSAPVHTPDALRRAARLYEVVVLEYPTSGYSDNALWQAACLLQRSFEISANAKDRDGAARLLAWLKKEYPHSTLGKQALPQSAAAVRDVPNPTTPPIPPPAPKQNPAQKTPAASRPAVAVRGISQSDLPRGDRITIELSAEASFTGERVTNPDRIFFDFTNSAVAAQVAERARAIKTPLIKTVRIGSPVAGITRVVFELVGAPRFSTFPLYEPFRLVVDVEADAPPADLPALGRPQIPVASASQAAAITEAPPPPPQPGATAQAPSPAGSSTTAAGSTTAAQAPQATPAPPSSTRSGDYSLARQLGLRVARVVIDPGHGGHDPGAQANGVTEAELVLDVALRLEKLLQQVPGLEVVLTRRTNEFIPLEERTAIANRVSADLFLSIHANAHRQAAVRGVETYFLNFSTNPEAEAVAARENATSAQTMGTLPAIVKAIALNNKLAESREFATVLQTQLVRKLRVQSSAIRDLGVKQAPFVVLIGAQMPSVLTEIAFLTNKPESGLLKQGAYRQQIAQALKDSVVRYQESLKKVTTVAAKDGIEKDR